MRTAATSVVVSMLSLLAPTVIAQTETKNDPPPLTCGCPSGLKKGDASVTFAYERTSIKKHFFSLGEEIDRGRVRGDAAVLALDYAFSDRFVVNVAVPYVVSSYHGKNPHAGSAVDDGARHGTYQDLRVDLRYHMAIGQSLVTPFIGYVMPTHHYATLGHAVAGHALREQSAGVNIEHNIERILPGSFVQGRYAFTRAERVLDISHNRSNLELNIGYFVHPQVSVRAIWSLQKTYGGIDLPLAKPLTGDFFIHHDQLSRADYVAVGLGASYAMNDAVSLFASGQKMLHGRNGHKLEFSPTIGVTYSFSTLRANSCAIN